MLVAALVAPFPRALPLRADAPVVRVFPLRLHIAYTTRARAPVFDSWANLQIMEANRQFACADVQFRVIERSALRGRTRRLDDEAAFAAAGALADDESAIDVFVVRSLRVGRHRDHDFWGLTAQPGVHPFSGFVAVQREPWAQLVTHELGHYFGLFHSRDRGNVMGQFSEGSWLSARQCHTLRTSAATLSVPPIAP